MHDSFNLLIVLCVVSFRSCEKRLNAFHREDRNPAPVGDFWQCIIETNRLGENLFIFRYKDSTVIMILIYVAQHPLRHPRRTVVRAEDKFDCNSMKFRGYCYHRKQLRARISRIIFGAFGHIRFFMRRLILPCLPHHWRWKTLTNGQDSCLELGWP